MSISNIVLMGYGNGTVAGNVNLLPTIGYSIGELVLSNPAIVGELSIYHPGHQAATLYSPGQQVGQSFQPGMKAGDL